tara:strand:- start:967 stop:1434 length:468 start_codon:yes stop_codon:yes gene_type:complete
MIISAKTQESEVKQIIATLREERPDWLMVWRALVDLRAHEYRDIDAVWAYASDHARRTIAELDGCEVVLDVWAAGDRICLDCYHRRIQASFVWSHPLRSIVEQSPTFWSGPRAAKCIEGSTCSTGYAALASRARRAPAHKEEGIEMPEFLREAVT